MKRFRATENMTLCGRGLLAEHVGGSFNEEEEEVKDIDEGADADV